MSQQQTVLRVQTNIPSDVIITGTTSISLTGTSVTITGAGTLASPYTGTTTGGTFSIEITNTGGAGTLYYDINVPSYSSAIIDNSFLYYRISCSIVHANGFTSGNSGFENYAVNNIEGSFGVIDGDKIYFNGGSNIPTGTTYNFYVLPDIEVNNTTVLQHDFLDLYDDIPIKINKSYSELEDISKRNSDYSLGLTLPGSKKNNRFFEEFYNVDAQSLYFNVTKRVPCDVLIDDETYFKGYLRLNKVSVLNSKVEYDVTLYSSVGDLFGKIGNNLLKDLDFDNIDYHFNHYFNMYNVTSTWNYNTLKGPYTAPSLWMYPVVHNGYEYSGDTVNLSGGTIQSRTRLYTSTNAGDYADLAAFYAAGGKDYRINSPINPILDNQLKPALNVWGLIQLMFAEYGYTIKSEFFKSPWFKLLYTYGYFSSDTTKFSYNIGNIPSLPIEGVEIYLMDNPPPNPPGQVYCIAVKKGTGIPVYCAQDINFTCYFVTSTPFVFYPVNYTLYANTSGTTMTFPVSPPGIIGAAYVESAQVDTYEGTLAYRPIAPNTFVTYVDGDYINFSQVIDYNLKQIDFLASIAKKFSLVFIPDPEVPNQIIIEPYQYYIGTGDVLDWSDKISFDKGFTVEPALNYIESEVILTDLEDGDDGNKIFKDKNNRVYGQNKVFNPTDFKSQTKEIKTIYSPEVIRKWDDNVGLPLGINYAASSQSLDNGGSQSTVWFYKGLKSKPKLIYNLGNLSPFLDQVGESYDFAGSQIITTFFRTQPSNGVNPPTYINGMAYYNVVAPVISHTMPMGNPDGNKINNDSICNLFNSELPADIGIGIPTFEAYTENDAYSLFYQNRIDNLYNQNTRFLTGNFYLNLNDIKNIKANDLIKINNQYFTWNKIDGYNLTNRELTKVELIQTNLQPATYPTRYFKYQYCGNGNVYKFRTYFDPELNPGPVYEFNGEVPSSIRRTYYFWSILYDYMVGVLGGSVSGYTSSYTYAGFGETWAYNISEIDETEYNSITLTHLNDPNNLLFIDSIDLVPSRNIDATADYVWLESNQIGYDQVFFNVAVDCTTFLGYCTTNHVTLQPAPTPI